MSNQPALVLLTKKPVTGQVKTRLTSDTSAETAAAIAWEMIVETVETAVAHWPGEVRMLVSPDADHCDLTDLASRCSFEIGPQAEGDLGEKMESAISNALRTAPAAALMGCDIPDISGKILKLAYSRLAEGYNVIGPSADGGFYFAGLNRCEPDMFDGIEWSTEHVLQIVLHRMRACKIPIDTMLPCLQDIDYWKDFEHLARNKARYRSFLNEAQAL